MSKYFEAGTGFWMLPKRTKKSVTCCDQRVTVPSAYIGRHCADVNIFCAPNCSFRSASGTCW